jgi:hypothetical protein
VKNAENIQNLSLLGVFGSSPASKHCVMNRCVNFDLARVTHLRGVPDAKELGRGKTFLQMLAPTSEIASVPGG